MTTSKLLQQFIGATIICLLMSSRFGFSQHRVHPDPEVLPDFLISGAYVVVGVFSFQDNAIKFTNYVSSQGWVANYAYHPPNRYYYVYTLSANAVHEAVPTCLQLREHSEFYDAWIFLSTYQPGPEAVWKDDPAIATEVSATEVNESSMATQEDKPEKDQATLFYLKFQTYHANTKEPVSATVTIVDGVHVKTLAKTPTGKIQEIDKTAVPDSSLQIIPYALGFRKEQFDLPLYTSAKDSTHQLIAWEGDTLMMNMPLSRLKKGDIQVMFNTYFHGNSSVMRERSRYELEELVKLLEENPNMRIKLHGHTNGTGRGFIYVFSPKEKNFFDLRRSKEYKKRGIGSIKLSSLRTETIKSYLEHRGISPDRIETKGWGGKRLLYDPNSELATHNIRVEIEVLDE